MPSPPSPASPDTPPSPAAETLPDSALGALFGPNPRPGAGALPSTEVILRHRGIELTRATLPPGEYVIGRAVEVEIRADSPFLAPRHARLTINFDHALIEDLGSDAGAFVAGQRITECARLFPNQAIRLGEVELKIRRHRPAVSPETSLAPAQTAIRHFVPDEVQAELRYAIGSIVARGGMGAILDAEQAGMKRHVAMKVMLESNEAADVARFVDEAQITGQLEHPNIVPVHELGVDENDQLFYTMKLVRGITLAKVLELLAAGTAETAKKYSLPALLTIFQKACDAIAFAHSKGVIHRDLKPENIMLGDFGEVLVMDWGLAKVVAGKPSGSDASAPTRTLVASSRQAEPEFGSTMAGAIMGTPHYMAPEQARGEVESLDARADIYALGAILFQLLSLRRPVEGDDAWEIVARVAEGKTSSLLGTKRLPHLPGGRPPDSLAAVVHKAMALERDARYRNVEALQADIAAYQSGFATSAEQAGALKLLALLIKRNKTASVGAAILMALSAAFTIKVIAEGRRAELALADLRRTAPEFAARAGELFAHDQFDEAARKLDYAIQLDPSNPGYRLAKANYDEAQLRLLDAAGAYRDALRLDPGQAQAKDQIALCEQLERTRGADGKLPRAALSRLLDAMTKANRPPAEKFAVAKQLGRENSILWELWLARLKGLPVGSKPLKDRLVIDADGRMRLDLSETTLSDLSPLRGMPLSELNIGRTLARDLSPLAGMPLEKLTAINCGITTVAPLAGMPLSNLNLDGNRITDLSPLAGMPLTSLQLAESPITDLSPLRGMPLTFLDINGFKTPDLSALRGLRLWYLDLTNAINVTDLSPLTGMPLREIGLGNCTVADLSPLGGCPLEKLFMGGSRRISDLSPIAQPKLKVLTLNLCSAVKDLRPLAACLNLEELVLPPNAGDIAFLRTMPKLKLLNAAADVLNKRTAPADQFWQEYDAKQAAEKR